MKRENLEIISEHIQEMEGACDDLKDSLIQIRKCFEDELKISPSDKPKIKWWGRNYGYAKTKPELNKLKELRPS